jgi:hypothetical protein
VLFSLTCLFTNVLFTNLPLQTLSLYTTFQVADLGVRLTLPYIKALGLDHTTVRLVSLICPSLDQTHDCQTGKLALLLAKSHDCQTGKLDLLFVGSHNNCQTGKLDLLLVGLHNNCQTGKLILPHARMFHLHMLDCVMNN